jgi:alpha-L-arabinofuranosidase
VLHDLDVVEILQALDAVAERSSDGKTLFVKCSNADPAKTLQTTITFVGAQILPREDEVLLSAHGSESLNTFADPNAVLPVKKSVRCTTNCRVELPPDSVAVLPVHLK